MTIVASGPVTQAYVDLSEVKSLSAPAARVALCLRSHDWIEFTGVTLGEDGGFHLPAPLGCNCTVSDISDRNWEHANYEIEFSSSYSREGVFFAKSFRRVSELKVGITSSGTDA